MYSLILDDLFTVYPTGNGYKVDTSIASKSTTSLLIGISNTYPEMVDTIKKLKDNYEKYIGFYIVNARMVFQKESIIDNLKNEKDTVYGCFSENMKLLEAEINENRQKLKDIEKDASKVALEKNFKDFIKYLNTKLRWTKLTKIISFTAMLLSPSINFLYFSQDNSLHFIFIKVLITLVVLLTFSVLFRVSLRKEDQLEQLLYKASNKTSVIYYYEEHRHMLNKENDSEVEKEFYNYLFREMETREWNSPDVGQSIIDLIKAVKSS